MRIVCKDKDIRYNILIHYWKRFLSSKDKPFPSQLLETDTFELDDIALDMLPAMLPATCFKEKEITQNMMYKHKIVFTVIDHEFVFLDGIVIIPQGYIYVVGKIVKLETIKDKYQITARI